MRPPLTRSIRRAKDFPNANPYPVGMREGQFDRNPYGRASEGKLRLAKQKIPSALWVAIIALALIFGWGPNLWLLAFSLFVLAAGTLLTWRPRESAVLLYCFGIQWLQASAAIFYANWNGVDIEQAAGRGGASDMADATRLSLLGILVIFAGIRLAVGSSNRRIGLTARSQAKQVKVPQLIIAYAGAFFFALACKGIGQMSPGLQQPMLALANLTSVVTIIVLYVGVVRGGTYRQIAIGVFSLEFLLALGGFWASFQTIFIYAFIAVLAARPRLSASRLLAIGFLTTLALALGVVWTAIKIDYREYVNGGTGQQIVTVSWPERMETLAQMVTEVDGVQFAQGADALAQRIMYVEFFGGVLETVPRSVPHTDGEMWAKAIAHPFTPRILFPDKPILDDSVMTRQYSGFWVAGREMGTSISIGYIAQTYIDFGPYGMFAALACFGLGLGWLYSFVLRMPRLYGMVSMFSVAPLLIESANLEQSLEKSVGSIIVTFLAISIIHILFSENIKRLIFSKSK